LVLTADTGTVTITLAGLIGQHGTDVGHEAAQLRYGIPCTYPLSQLLRITLRSASSKERHRGPVYPRIQADCAPGTGRCRRRVHSVPAGSARLDRV
jgi:hypothetical protein